MQAERVMAVAAGEIGLAGAGVVRDRQPEHLVEVMLHLAFLDGVEREKAEIHHFDRHDFVVHLQSARILRTKSIIGGQRKHCGAHQQAGRRLNLRFPPAAPGDIFPESAAAPFRPAGGAWWRQLPSKSASSGSAAGPRCWRAPPRQSDKLEIVAGYSRSEEKRAAFEQEFGVAGGAGPADACWPIREIKGVILTVPNEQHLPLAREVAQGRQARLHREADRQHARRRARDRGAGEDLRRQRHGRPQRAADGRHPHDQRRRSTPASSAASPSWRRISPTSARSSSRRRPGAGTRTARRAGRCRSSRSTSSTCCTISAARSSRRARWRPSSRRSAPRSTTSR